MSKASQTIRAGLLLAAGLLAAATGCGGSGGNPAGLFALSLESPAELRAGLASELTVRVTGGQGPYQVSIDFGGGAEPNELVLTIAGSQARRFSVTPLLGTWTARASVTDANGMTASDDLAFAPLRQSEAPHATVAGVMYNHLAERLELRLEARDADNNFTARLELPAGWSADPAEQLVSGGDPRTIVFRLTWPGGEGSLDPPPGPDSALLLLDDGHGVVEQSLGPLQEEPTVTLPPINLPDDALFAVPLKASARVGEAVPVQILTGLTPQPLLYVEVAVTVEEDGSPLPGLTDYGVASSDPSAIDGIWASLGMTYFLRGDSAVSGFPPINWLPGGRRYWGCYVTPMGGTAAPVQGGVAVLDFVFTEPGTKTFGFLAEQNGMRRTYYSGTGQGVLWGDVSNSVIGIPNSVEILP